MFTSGTTSLVSGAQDVLVSFNLVFTAVPPVVIPYVFNTSGDDSMQLITAFLDTKTTSSFTVHLSAPTPTANYSLSWIAGDAQGIVQVLTTGKMASAFPALGVAPLDTDYFLLTHTAGAPETMRIPWSLVRAGFPALISAIPGSPAAAGVAGQIVISPKYIYTCDGTLWGQTPRNTTSWSPE